MSTETQGYPVELIRKQVLENILELRDDRKWTDDIPSEILKPDHPNYYNYRCRGAWFSSIASEIVSLLRRDQTLSTEIRSECENFIEFVQAMPKRDPDRTTDDDIEKGKLFLDHIINYLKTNS
ncbi:MAG: hypothetical protein WCX97_01065 [Candidatus Magasanikbacteria bacterium]